MAVHGELGFDLSEVERRSERATVRGINKWARAVLRRAIVYAPIGPPTRRANGQFAPRVPSELGELHPGHLKNSGKLVKEATAGDPNAEVAFTAVYAAAQHENIDWNHPQGGFAKYLQRAFVEMWPELPQYVGAELELEFG